MTSHLTLSGFFKVHLFKVDRTMKGSVSDGEMLFSKVWRKIWISISWLKYQDPKIQFFWLLKTWIFFSLQVLLFEARSFKPTWETWLMLLLLLLFLLMSLFLLLKGFWQFRNADLGHCPMFSPFLQSTWLKPK